MKYWIPPTFIGAKESPPAREVWVEIGELLSYQYKRWSPPAREVWVEIVVSSNKAFSSGSPPAREVWVEILPELRGNDWNRVASREGGVG